MNRNSTPMETGLTTRLKSWRSTWSRREKGQEEGGRGATLLYSLTPDYDPWAGFEWPDRSGELKRAPRKKSSPGS